MKKYLKIYTDGGSRGNPGKAACGMVIFDENDRLIEIDAKYLGIMTNNQAEYQGLIEALRMAQSLNYKKLKCYLDSELIVRQLNGIYKIKNDNIKEYKKTIDTLLVAFKEVEYIHVRREKNIFADKLVNIVLDNIENESI